MWRVVKAMEQRESGYSAFGPRYSTGIDDGREMKGKEGHFQLAKGGARRETDLAVVVLASACFSRSQAALQSIRAIPRSQVACGAFTGDFTAIWVLLGAFGLFFRSHHPGAGWCDRKKKNDGKKCGPRKSIY